MAKYYLTNKAVEDLTKIWEYTYKKWSEQQADKYYVMLISNCNEIAKNPTIGKKYVEIIPELCGLRANRYIIFYREIKQDKIEIIRILHGRMDLKKRLLE